MLPPDERERVRAAAGDRNAGDERDQQVYRDKLDQARVAVTERARTTGRRLGTGNQQGGRQAIFPGWELALARGPSGPGPRPRRHGTRSRSVAAITTNVVYGMAAKPGS